LQQSELYYSKEKEKKGYYSKQKCNSKEEGEKKLKKGSWCAIISSNVYL
jgi:hypothetical protein